MKTSVRNILVLSLMMLAFSGSTIAQKGKVRKANKEFDKYAYIDAREIYLKVVEDGYESAEIYKNLGDTYYFNSDYQQAAKWYEKLIQTFPGQTGPEYYYRAAQSLKSTGKTDQAESLLENYIAEGGEGFVIKSYDDDPDYLKSSVFRSRDFTVEKVAINTSLSDFGPAFYGKDKIVYASAGGNTTGSKTDEWTGQPFLDLFVADRDDEGRLSNPRQLEGTINTPYHESSAAFTKDGNTVYFTRNNYLEGKTGKDKSRKFKTVRLKIYKATKTGDNTWGNVEELPFNSNSYSTAHPALNKDETRLYFSSDMPGTLGQSDLWYVEIKEDGTMGDPVNLGPEVNTAGRETFPYISEKNNLYFSSDGRSGYGGFDIFVTPLLEDGTPEKAINLGEPANSPKDDFGFIIDEEAQIGYLSSNRGSDTAGSVDDDIYLVKESCLIKIEGLVFDKNSNDPLPGAEVSLLDRNNQVVGQTLADDDGNYFFDADCETQYTIRGSMEGYHPYEEPVKTPAASGTINVPLPLEHVGPCAPHDLGCRLNLQPIYFDFDKWNIRPDAEVELAKILAAMREYPELVIHIESHTDSRGSDSYNMILSERRAQSTRDWLIAKGIDENRLTAKGYGESQLVNHCSNNVPCSAEEHQLNRRSMFIIQN